MSTVTSIVIENQSQSDPKSTWTIVASGDDYSITTTGQTITIASPPYMIAQYIGSRKNRCSVWINGWLSMTSPTYTERQITTFFKNLEDSAISSGTVFTLPDNSQSFPYTIDGNTIFTSSNPTTKNVPIYVSATLMHAYSWNSNGEVFNGYEGYLAFSPNHTIGTVYYSCPPALSACSISKNTSAGYYVGLTTVTVSVPITYSASGTTGTAKYGGYIKKIDVTIGGQTVTKTFTESTKPTNTQTFSIQLANAGTFTPTITVTDSRDQAATQELPQITVNAYDVPSISFDVFRTNSSGVKSDEGTYGLIVADITYTDAIATITEPSVTIDGTATSNVTWYSSYSSSTGVSSTISNWASLTPTDHSVTVYGLVNESFNIGQSYVIGMSDEDSLGGQSQTVSQTLSTAFYTIDFQAGGKEIAFGAPANDNLAQHPNGLFKCAMDVRFEGDISGISTSTPVEDTIAEFDSSAHMNSTDMTAQEIQDFVDGNLSGQEAITRNDLRSVLDDVLPTRTLLWTNPNPSASSFGPQNISLSGAWDTYDYIETLYLASYTANIDVGQQVMERTPCHAETTVSYVTYSNNRWEIWHRGRWWNAAHTAIHFADAYYDAIGASGSGVWNGNMIPYKIYGIKA